MPVTLIACAYQLAEAVREREAAAGGYRNNRAEPHARAERFLAADSALFRALDEWDAALLRSELVVFNGQDAARLGRHANTLVTP